MIDQLKKHLSEVADFSSDNPKEIEAFRIKYLGKKGLLSQFFSEFKNIPAEEKKEFGQTINELKSKATEKVNLLKKAIEQDKPGKNIYNDLTRPSEPMELGVRHPISIVKNQIIDKPIETANTELVCKIGKKKLRAPIIAIAIAALLIQVDIQ